MSQDMPNAPDSEQDDQPVPVEGPVENKEIDEFFQRLPGNFRWPKPNAEAVAAAVEAIQRLSGGTSAAEELASDGAPQATCSACGGSLPADAHFCVWCGVPVEAGTGNSTVQSPQVSGQQHHIHHHYHHIAAGQGIPGYVMPGYGIAPGVPVEPESAASPAPRGRAPGSAASTGGRAEASARQVVQDWAQACNNKHIDDLLELYAADATLIRSSVPPVRSLPAIREFLISMLEAGLGDVEMESLRLDVMGEIALDLGRCKMLVPIAMGKRREERGKYVIVLVRQPVGTWKIMVDSWSADLAVSAPPLEPRKGK
jgi:ketosteroid isomerase-like protein